MTPAHQAFREKRADDFSARHSGNEFMDPIGESFRKGMEAEHEVARLMGRIDGVTWAAKFADENYWISPKQRESLYEEARRLEAQLAAIFAGGAE